VREPVVAVVEATPERITFANAQTGYTVARVDPGRGGELVTVVGRCWARDRRETLRLRGRWGAHRQYGR
jgi:exodeoxyribonuclease V alpha subunit